MSIPASFRRVLEAGDPGWDTGKQPEFVIVYGDHRRNYLECYTIAAIEDVEERIEEMPRGSSERRLLERTFSGMSADVVVDDTGRFVLTQKLRDKIGVNLDSEAFFIASGDTFQIWNPDTYEQEQARTEQLLDDLPEDVDVLALLPRKKPQGD
ncbi:MraZ protein [Roseivivax lentus]|uniref:Transcriptional regulator MraZ n=1 Tax=Roseivivax lentus TaxID=633194 RepID=A0A1N7NZU6_9RHOB|nr:MraZ protein [Roseivivax lentus]